jgi:hypothetical protein
MIRVQKSAAKTRRLQGKREVREGLQQIADGTLDAYIG